MPNKSTLNRRYGWRKQHFDARDFKFVHAGLADNDLPQESDTTDQFSSPYDQGQLGSCTGNGLAAMIEHQYIKNNYEWKFRPSRLFIYYNERLLEGTVASDSGAEIRDGIKVVNQYGVCPEIENDGTNPDWLWPYSDDANTFKQQPKPECYRDAVLHKALQYQAVDINRSSILNTLAAGRPIVFGFTVNQSFESQEIASTGVMQVPGWNIIDPVIGGHCVVAVGYKLNTPMGTQGVKDWAKVRNSWGTSWGQDGYFYMPLDQVLCNQNISSDAWTIDLVSGTK